MDKKNQYRSKSDDDQKKPSGRRNYIIGRNQEKSNKRTGGPERIGER